MSSAKMIVKMAKREPLKRGRPRFHLELYPRAMEALGVNDLDFVQIVRNGLNFIVRRGDEEDYPVRTYLEDMPQRGHVRPLDDEDDPLPRFGRVEISAIYANGELKFTLPEDRPEPRKTGAEIRRQARERKNEHIADPVVEKIMETRYASGKITRVRV